MRPVDYALIYRLEDERHAQERAYVCPFWDWIKDFRDRFADEYWWGRVPEWPGNGMAEIDDDEDPLIIADEVSGEIPWR